MPLISATAKEDFLRSERGGNSDGLQKAMHDEELYNHHKTNLSSSLISVTTRDDLRCSDGGIKSDDLVKLQVKRTDTKNYQNVTFGYHGRVVPRPSLDTVHYYDFIAYNISNAVRGLYS